MFYQRPAVYVSRAVGKDPLWSDGDDELRAFPNGEEVWLVSKLGHPLDPHAIRSFEVDEQERDSRVHQHVAEASELPVAVVARKRERGFVEDPYETGKSSLVRDVWPAIGVSGSKKEQVGGLHERLVLSSEGVVDCDLF